MLRILFLLLINFFLVTGCCQKSMTSAEQKVEIEPIPACGYYRVESDDTLYEVAERFGIDYRYLIKRNHLVAPYKINTGQKLYLTGELSLPTKPAEKQLTEPPKVTEPKEPNKPVTAWLWPAKGRIIGKFCAVNQGINISGQRGTPIFAAAPGKVVYCGDGLRAYGNLIIIKHNGKYLTTYAHNSAMFVKTGDWVKGGQKIAEMGDTGAHRVMLHFEIRKNGQAVNPKRYLT